MCCSSKKKPVGDAPRQSANTVSPLTYENSPHNKQPRSKVSFLAQGYDFIPMNNQSAFVAIQRATEFPADSVDRDENYAQQYSIAKEPKLIAPQQLLNYDLDGLQGVAGNPTVDTFHYQAVLRYCFVHDSEQSNGQSKQNYQPQQYNIQRIPSNNGNNYNQNNVSFGLTPYDVGEEVGYRRKKSEPGELTTPQFNYGHY